MKSVSLFRRLALGAALSFFLPWLAATETVPAPAAGATAAALKEGELAPDFTVIGPDGREMKLSDFRGKLVLVDIWATWCGPCIASMPHQSSLAEKFADEGLVILAVCASDTRQNYDGWVQRNQDRYKFITAHDPAGRNWSESVFNTHYGVRGFPTLFLIDREGRLVGQASGGGPSENPRVTRLLAKGGLSIDTSHLPPEKTDGPSSIPAVRKTPAQPAGSVPMMGGMRPAGASADKLGSLKAGEPMPDFSVQGVSGQAVRMADFKGKVTLVTFFSHSERGPEAYAVEAFEKHRGQGVEFLAVGTAMAREQFDAFAAKAKPGYTLAWDPAGRAFMEGVAHMEFGIGMYPAFAVVDKDGVLVGGYIGAGPRSAPVLNALLAKAGVKVEGAPAAPAAQSIPMGAIRPSPPAPAGAQRRATLGVGAIAPDFVMQNVDGKEVRLADYAGKIVILDFWATWCGPCIASFPHAQEIAAQYKDQDVVFLASGTSDTIEKFKEWIPRNQPKYPDMVWAFDLNERGSETFEERASSKLYGVTGIPTQFVIGRDGKIAAVIVGNGGKNDARTEAALAGLGVKVDEAVATKGREQLAAAAERERARQRAAAEEANAGPRPRFSEKFGQLEAGSPVPDAKLLDAEGNEVSLAELGRGKTVVLSVGVVPVFMPPGQGNTDMLAFNDAWARKYADQGVLFVNLASYAGREQVDAWREANTGKFSFPVYSDPAGAPPRPPKPMDELSDEEAAAFRQASSAYFPRTVPLQLTGGAMAPVPHNLVIDAQGRMVGFFGGAGQSSKDSLANLLLRAGIKLAPEDMPAKVFTKEETKPAAPEPRREMIKIGALAPDFVTQDLAGKDVRLSDYRGQVIILDFWATWCGPCIAAFPHTQEVAAQYKDQGVVVLASGTSDARAAFERWVPENQTKYPDIHFSHDAAERKPERASLALYGVSGIPTQFIIDREGRIVDIVIGYRKGEVILDAALAKAGVKVDPAILEKAEADLKRRAALRG